MKIAFKTTHYGLLLTALTLLICVPISAQEEPPSLWSQIRYGGGLGLSFGNGFFGGTIAPSAIYQFDDQFALGVGTTFTYNSQKNRYNTTIIGGSLIGLYNVIPEIQLSTELEALNVSRSYDAGLGIANDLYWYPALFFGAGFRAGNFTAGIRYDVLYDEEKSIYANPWLPFVRVYF
ncbi:MAG: alpha-ketoglutarate decarboxylase [Altibacter sp.]|nr:alpha-ketoglutarate decarboxylase [Altibacter sp.]